MHTYCRRKVSHLNSDARVRVEAQVKNVDVGRAVSTVCLGVQLNLTFEQEVTLCLQAHTSDMVLDQSSST